MVTVLHSAVFNICFLALAYFLYLKTRTFERVCAFGIVFFYTGYAFNFLVDDDYIDNSSLNYLIYNFGFFANDSYYLQSFYLLSAFTVVVFVCLLLFPNLSSLKKFDNLNGYKPKRLLAFSFVSLILSFFIIHDYANIGQFYNFRYYEISRASSGGLYNLHLILNQVGLFSMTVLLIIKFKNKTKTSYYFDFITYTILAQWTFFLILLGNRHELIVCLLFYFTYDLSLSKIKKSFLAYTLAAFFFLRVIEICRGVEGYLYVDTLLNSFLNFSFFSVQSMISGSEAFASHLSNYYVLKYGVINENGVSLKWLLANFIPLIDLFDYSDTSYTLVYQSLNLPSNQGFTVHFVAGSFLNGGVLFVCLFMLLLMTAFYFLGLFFNHSHFAPQKKLLYIYFFAYYPFSIRSGPECFKALFFEGLLIPLFILCTCYRGNRSLPINTFFDKVR